jgi:hypothetical protein
MTELSQDFVARQFLLGKTCLTCGIGATDYYSNHVCVMCDDWDIMCHKYLTCPDWVNPKDCIDD